MVWILIHLNRIRIQVPVTYVIMLNPAPDPAQYLNDKICNNFELEIFIIKTVICLLKPLQRTFKQEISLFFPF
jgi:hypothetical protein